MQHSENFRAFFPLQIHSEVSTFENQNSRLATGEHANLFNKRIVNPCALEKSKKKEFIAEIMNKRVISLSLWIR